VAYRKPAALLFPSVYGFFTTSSLRHYTVTVSRLAQWLDRRHKDKMIQDYVAGSNPTVGR
jgi:hypothetical protein